MKVQVRLFALAKQLANQDTVDFELPEDATVADLRTAFHGRFPELQALGTSVRFAVQAEFVAEDTALQPGNDIACIPPVSGG